LQNNIENNHWVLFPFSFGAWICTSICLFVSLVSLQYASYIRKTICNEVCDCHLLGFDNLFPLMMFSCLSYRLFFFPRRMSHNLIIKTNMKSFNQLSYRKRLCFKITFKFISKSIIIVRSIKLWTAFIILISN